MDDLKIKGRIMKGVGGFYDVMPISLQGSAEIYQCRARGIFRKRGMTPCVGDLVEMTLLSEEEHTGVVDEILPRKNVFVRPPIANVDCLVTVIAATHPEPNFHLLDQFLVMAETMEAEVVLCINKTDLVSPKKLEEMLSIYRPLYATVCTSGRSGEGISTLAQLLKGKKSALSGPSGVGKSTLLNQLLLLSFGYEGGGETMATGAISHKSSRGRHTTRHVELFQLKAGGMLFDTPGFTSFDIMEEDEEDLAYCYPEMRPLIGQCRYDNCRHLKEPGCRVRQGLEDGEIHASRYESYATQMKDIQEKKKKY